MADYHRELPEATTAQCNKCRLHPYPVILGWFTLNSNVRVSFYCKNYCSEQQETLKMKHASCSGTLMPNSFHHNCLEKLPCLSASLSSRGKVFTNCQDFQVSFLAFPTAGMEKKWNWRSVLVVFPSFPILCHRKGAYMFCLATDPTFQLWIIHSEKFKDSAMREKSPCERIWNALRD